MNLRFALPLAFVTLCGLSAQPPSAWTPELTMQVQTVGPVVPSPDGTLVVWAQTKARMDSEHSEDVTQLWLAHADGSARFQLTRNEKSSTNPAWSPDGKWIYFTSTRLGKNDLYRIPPNGGEAERLTEVPSDIGGFEVSHDGRWVAYTAAPGDAEHDKAVKEKRDMRELDTKPRNFLIYVMPAEADAKGQRTVRAVTTSDRHVRQVAWSPDDTAIAFGYWATPVVNEWREAKIAEVVVASGAIKELGEGGGYQASLAYSRDGRYLAFTKPTVSVPYPGASAVVLYERRAGTVRQLSVTPDEEPRIIGWLAGDRALLVSETKHTGSAFFTLPIDGSPKETFAPAEGTVGSATMNDAATLTGFAYETSELAPEAYVLKPGADRPVQVSAANTSLPKPPLGRTEVFRWKAKDGQEIEGLLTYPAGYQSGQKVPLILNIHGGPSGTFTQSFIGRPGLYPLAVFASKGYAILRPNPRGSAGYGKAFRYANKADWGGGDFEDIQAGVDALISRGIVDSARMAVMGWSYGGYMTAWTIGHTNRFKAAALGAPVTDLLSFTGTTDIADFLPDYFGGDAWEKAELYRAHSPITYADKVTTPTLVLQGDADERVPLGQGLEFYHAVKRRGVPAKMVVYPRQPHGPTEPKFILDIMKQNLAWVDQYVH